VCERFVTRDDVGRATARWNTGARARASRAGVADASRTRARGMSGPYSGASSLSAFLRVGAVAVGVTYGVVVSGLTSVFGSSKRR